VVLKRSRQSTEYLQLDSNNRGDQIQGATYDLACSKQDYVERTGVEHWEMEKCNAQKTYTDVLKAVPRPFL
jgi:hypothetical protein